MIFHGFGRLGTARNIAFSTAMALVLAACGGGDDGPSAPPPLAAPPPPPSPVATNSAPVASITSDTTTPDEGQPFMVDASSSSDPDDDELTFIWTQVSGPDFEIADPTSPVQNFTAPELTETVTATFQVEISDGELFDTASVDVQLTNIVLEPAIDSFGAPIFERDVDGTPVGTIGLDSPAVGLANPDSLGFLSVTESSDLQFVFAERSFDLSFAEDQITAVDGAVSVSSVNDELLFLFDFPSDGRPADVIYPLEESDSVIGLTAVQDGAGFAYETLFQFSVEQPCAVEDVTIFNLGEQVGLLIPILNQRSGIFVGRREGGLQLVTFPDGVDGSPAVEPNLVGFPETGSFCHMNRGMLGGLPFVSNDVLAIDSEAQTYQIFLQNFDAMDDEPIYIPQPAIPLASDIADSLAVTDFFGIFAGSMGRLFAVTLSDNQHIGQHRLLVFRETGIVSSDGLGGRQPTTFELVSDVTWDLGNPSDLLITDIDNDSDLDVVVSLESAPFALLLENTSGVAGGFNSQFAKAQFFEVGLGATEVSFFDFSVADLPRLLFTYGSRGQLRIFENSEALIAASSAAGIGGEPTGQVD